MQQIHICTKKYYKKNVNNDLIELFINICTYTTKKQGHKIHPGKYSKQITKTHKDLCEQELEIECHEFFVILS